MKERAIGQKVYVNLWPAWADFEDVVYRPLLLKVFPAVLGFACNVFDKMFDFFTKVILMISGSFCNLINHIPDILAKSSIAIGSFICGCLDVTTDGFLVLLRKTIYQDSGEEEHPYRQGFYHWYTLKYSAFKENTTLIGRSLSYGLILFCLGLCVTLIYLLVSAMR
jgi:hydrogenase-4 component B